MGDFYINVTTYKSNLLVTAVEGGKHVRYKVHYHPYVFIEDKDAKLSSPYRTVDDKVVRKVDFESIYEGNKFVREHRDLMQLYGMTAWAYAYINDLYPQGFAYDITKISIVDIDIEVKADAGFPSIDNADKAVTLITISKNGLKDTFGCGDYTPNDFSVKYHKCKDEKELLATFLLVWRSKKYDPDIITGWNIERFDIPYLWNRISKILGKEFADMLSPWKIVEEREIVERGTGYTYRVKTLYGIAQLDYLQLYKKFSYTPQESYKLDHIANYEIKARKLDYSEHKDLLTLYHKDFPKYVDYNIRDVDLVDGIEKKMRLIEQVIAIAFDARINFQDTLTNVRMWDVIIHNYLLERNIVVPIRSPDLSNDRQIQGAFVKEPQTGMFRWIVSFDFTSLYPHLFMEMNISPETYRSTHPDITVDSILNGKLDELRPFINEHDIAVAGSGSLFDRSKQGFLPAIMERMFGDRAAWKKRMIAAEIELEALKQQKSSKEEQQVLEYRISQAKNMQQAKKIILNAGYGALANVYHRWYDTRLAESVTLSGQVAIQWVQRDINDYINKIAGTKDIDYVIAGDTDSFYVTMEKIVDKYIPGKSDSETCQLLLQICKENLEPFINQSLKNLAAYMNTFGKLNMKREIIATKGVWTGKKHYALNVLNKEGVQYDKPESKIQGLESVRSSTPAICRKKFEESIKIVLNDNEDKLIEFIENFREQFKMLPFDEIASPRTANNLEKYKDGNIIYRKGTPIAVKGALLFNHYLKQFDIKDEQPIHSGDKIKFVYLLTPNPINDMVIAVPGRELPPQFGLDQYIDRTTQFEKGFLEPIKSITDAISWKTEEVNDLYSLFQ